MSADRPLSSAMADFWSYAPVRPDPPRHSAPAPARLDRPVLTIRHRNLATLLTPAYDTFARHATP